jgi:uncharacterized OB-fold protein
MTKEMSMPDAGGAVTTMPTTWTGPVPVAEPESEPFWQSLRNHALAFQRCDGCRRWIHPPLPLCPRCASDELSYRPASGRGQVFSYTVVRRHFGAGVDVPYAAGYVETDEGLRVAAYFVGCPVDEVDIGMRVRADYADYPDQELTLLLFRPEGR